MAPECLSSNNANWKTKKIGDLAKSERNSFVIGPFGSDLVQSDYKTSGVPVVFVRDIKRSRFQWVSEVFVSIEKAEKLKAHSAKSGDVIITKMGLPPGIAAVYPDNFPAGIITADIIRLRPDLKSVDSSFLCELLNSYSVRKQVYERTAGQTRPKLTLTDYKTIQLGLPPLPEQKKIAQILSTWDQAITATERLLENSQQRKKGLMQQLLTGKKRLPGFEGKWEATKVGKICKLGAGQSAPQGEEFFDKGTHDFLRVSDIGSSASRFAPVSRDKINDRAVKEKRLSKVPAGATVFTKSGASLLLNQRAQLKTGTYIVSHLGFANGTECSDDDFIYYLFCLIDFGKIAAGTSLPALQLSTLSQIKVTVPKQKQEQNAIAQILGAADREIDHIRRRLLLLKQEKKALMQQLLTGKRRVNVDTEAA